MCVCVCVNKSVREINWCFRGGFCCLISSLLITANFLFLLLRDTWFAAMLARHHCAAVYLCVNPDFAFFFFFFLLLTACCLQKWIVCPIFLRVAGDWSPDPVSRGWALSQAGIRQPVMKVFVFSLSRAIVTGRFFCHSRIFLIIVWIVIFVYSSPGSNNFKMRPLALGFQKISLWEQIIFKSMLLQFIANADKCIAVSIC